MEVFRKSTGWKNKYWEAGGENIFVLPGNIFVLMGNLKIYFLPM